MPKGATMSRNLCLTKSAYLFQWVLIGLLRALDTKTPSVVAGGRIHLHVICSII